MNKYNFFKVSLSEEMIKLNGELEFVAPFTRNHQQSQHVQEDWGTLTNINLLLKDTLHEAKIIIHEAGDLFSTFINKSNISTIGNFAQQSNTLRTNFSELRTTYQNKLHVQNSKNDDQYYFYENEKQFTGFRQEAYTEQQPYVVQESYTEKMPYQDTENYTETQWFYLDRSQVFARFFDKNFDPSNHQVRCFDHAPGSTGTIKHPNILTQCTSKLVPLTRAVTKYKDETKYKDVIKIKDVTKYRDVPEYKDIQVKKFNENKYNQSVNSASSAVEGIKDKISNLLEQVKSANTKMKQDITIEATEIITNLARESCNNSPSKRQFRIRKDCAYVNYQDRDQIF